jgi:hypothetical protein
MRGLVPLCLLTLLLPPAAFADAESELQAQWRGVWALTRTAVFSECSDHFTDNEVLGDTVAGKALRFAAGEPVQVSGVDWTISGLKLRLELREPFRVEWREGPYTLYDQRRCRVELKFPREARPNAAAASAAIARVLERTAAEADATSSPAWNRRQVEPYPNGYDRTRADYEAWKATQTNAAVQRKLDEAIDQAAHVVEWSQGDAEYAADFTAGLHERRDESFSSCSEALDSTFYVHGSGKASRRGWEDGQRLAWAVHLAAELRSCFVEALPAP